jgi:hypothetical protein
MVDGDVELAEAVTHTRIAVPQPDGSVIIDRVLESLESTPPLQSTSRCEDNVPLGVPLGVEENNFEMNISRSPSPLPKKSKVFIKVVVMFFSL